MSVQCNIRDVVEPVNALQRLSLQPDTGYFQTKRVECPANILLIGQHSHRNKLMSGLVGFHLTNCRAEVHSLA